MKNFLFVSFLFLLTAGRAWACSCVEEKLAEDKKVAKSYARASVVFTGRVVKAETVTVSDTIHAPAQHSGRDSVSVSRREIIRYTFAISQLFKGENVGKTITIESATQSAACGVNFATGSEQLIYGFAIQNNSRSKAQPASPRYAVSLCSRHQSASTVKSAEMRQLRRMAEKYSGEHKFTWFELGD